MPATDRHHRNWSGLPELDRGHDQQSIDDRWPLYRDLRRAALRVALPVAAAPPKISSTTATVQWRSVSTRWLLADATVTVFAGGTAVYQGDMGVLVGAVVVVGGAGGVTIGLLGLVCWRTTGRRVGVGWDVGGAGGDVMGGGWGQARGGQRGSHTQMIGGSRPNLDGTQIGGSGRCAGRVAGPASSVEPGTAGATGRIVTAVRSVTEALATG